MLAFYGRLFTTAIIIWRLISNNLQNFIQMDPYLQPALNLHEYLFKKHWDGKAIAGPDPVGKIHWRVTRFVRSYFPWLPGDDRYVYIQAQGHWIRANLTLFELTENSKFMEIAGKCASNLVAIQPANGAWVHPPIWGRKGFISTVEGVWGSLGLTAAYRKTRNQAYLDAALKWYDFQINSIGFQGVGEGLAANYYSHSNSRVPNVTTMLLTLAAELNEVTGSSQYLEYNERMVRFIQDVQTPSGELPYEFPYQPHFMCYQYNSFQFLDLARYYELTRDGSMLPILNRLAGFLSTGVTARGSCKYNCDKDTPEVYYWTAALGAALFKANQLGLGDYADASARAYHRVLAKQKPNGRFGFSEKSYKLLWDSRSYPRSLAMILNHLSSRVKDSNLAGSKNISL